MAEGRGDFGYKDPDLDDAIDNDGYDYEQEADTTRPFQPDTMQPYKTSTPYGEKYEMQTMQDEQSGLPYYETTPLLTPSAEADLVRRLRALRENSLTGIIDT